jgi:hypothetical protein
VPGLGQIVQGRVAKGLLFFVCVYTLFFYGVYLGAAEVKAYGRTFRVTSNVYIPSETAEQRKVRAEQVEQDRKEPPTVPRKIGRTINYWITYPRPQIYGQFFVGVVFWPAIIQSNYSTDQSAWQEEDAKVTILYQEADALRAKGREEEANEKLELAVQEEAKLQAQLHPILGDFMREPSYTATNMAFNAGDKRLEIAWVFTVIAGVLNVLVIFDALMGPAYTSAEEAKRKAA